MDGACARHESQNWERLGKTNKGGNKVGEKVPSRQETSDIISPQMLRNRDSSGMWRGCARLSACVSPDPSTIYPPFVLPFPEMTGWIKTRPNRHQRKAGSEPDMQEDEYSENGRYPGSGFL